MAYVNTLNITAPAILNQNYTDTDMQIANGGYLAMAIINWVAMFGKYFIWIYYILGTRIIQYIETIIVNFDAANIRPTVEEVLALFENIGKVGTWPMSASMVFGSILNTTVTFWLFVWYMPLLFQWEPEMSAHQTTLDAFFYVWLILGWGQPVLAGLEWNSAWGMGYLGFECDPYRNCAHTWLTIYTFAEYLITFFVLVLCRYPQSQMYFKLSV